jgi:hypothetical protein
VIWIQSVSSATRARVARRDRRLQRVGAALFAQRFGARQRREAAVNQQLIPARAILLQQQDGLAVRAHPRRGARGLDFHQRGQAVHLGLVRHQPAQDAPEAQRIFAQRGSHPVVTGGRRIALVEDQVDDLEHGGEPRSQLGPARHLERHVLLG